MFVAVNEQRAVRARGQAPPASAAFPGAGKNEGRWRLQAPPSATQPFCVRHADSQARNRTPPPHVPRPRSVPPAIPPAPCTVTLPAHEPRAFTPPPAPLNMWRPAKRCVESSPQHAPQAISPRILPRRRFGAMRERFGTTLILRLPAPCHVAAQGLPASARYQAPRRRGVAALRALRLRSGTRQRHRLPALAVRKPRTAAGQLPRARRVWLPFGPARAVRHPSCRGRVLRAVRVCAHPFASVALRAWSPRPASLRSHHAASGSG